MKSNKKVDDEILIALYKDGLTYKEIASAFNVHVCSIFYYIKKHNLKREKPKPDHSYRNGGGPGHRGARMSKGTSLRKCRNNECNNYYYGDKRDRYCCKKCAVKVSNMVNRDAKKEWRRTQQIKARSMGERWDGKHRVLLDCEKNPEVIV